MKNLKEKYYIKKVKHLMKKLKKVKNYESFSDIKTLKQNFSKELTIFSNHKYFILLKMINKID